MKKILVLTAYSIFPPVSGGNKYIWNSLQLLAQNYELHLLSIGSHRELAGFYKNKKKYKRYTNIFKTIQFVKKPKIPYELNSLELIKHFFIHIWYQLPLMDCSYYSPQAVQMAKEIIDKYKIDFIECHQLQTAFYKKFIGKIPATMVYQNIESNLFPFWDLPRTINPIKRYIWKVLGKISRTVSHDVELRNKYDFQTLFFISNEEKALVDAYCPKIQRPITFPISTSNNINYLKKYWDESKTFRIIWIGGFDWWPNADAAHWFVDEIYPEILKCHIKKRIEFDFVGSNPPEELIKLQNLRTFRVHGFVDKIYPFFRSSDCLIAPLRQGGGIRIKIVEAMMKGIPVIATSKALEGLPVKNNYHVLIANSPKEFAKKIKRLSELDNLKFELSKNSIKFAKSYFNPSIVLNTISNAYRSLLNEVPTEVSSEDQ